MKKRREGRRNRWVCSNKTRECACWWGVHSEVQQMTCLNQEILLQKVGPMSLLLLSFLWSSGIWSFFSPFLTTLWSFQTDVRVASEVFQRTSSLSQDQRDTTIWPVLIPHLFSHFSLLPPLCSNSPELLTICWTNHSFFYLHKALPPALILLPANSSIPGLIIDATPSKKPLLTTPGPLSLLLCNIYSNPKHGVLILPS